ncbi:MAG: dihydropteroate synthase [Candidatus Omnitrophica bacterium]|nr:dihydropteroate synthase [Candidatus Omnitrophota bacterium]
METVSRAGALDISWDGYELALSKRTHIMGILNRTPDSFSDGGSYMNEDDAINRIIEMVSSGADIIDIGGESTRPGSSGISAAEELDRTIPVIKKASLKISIPISIDTSKSEVALEALGNGASIINDVTGLRGDPRMAEVAASFGVPVVLMHMRGTPQTMQGNPEYDSLLGEILKGLEGSIEIAKRAGVDEGKIIIDPGIGFGKTVEHNLKIINNLAYFTALKRPILIGVSRKSFIAKTLEKNNPNKEKTGSSGMLAGTISSCALCVSNGANILRVHNVEEISQAAKIADAITRS